MSRPRELSPVAGTSILEVLVALVLVAIVAVAAWAWRGTITTRELKNAAYLLEGDLRYAQQQAMSNAGGGPLVEVCFRTDGYDVYTTTYGGDPLNISPSSYTVMPGTLVKSVHSGQEYAQGIQIVPPGSTATVPCTANPALPAVAFRSSGQPLFQDAASHAITLTLGGQSMTVTIQPITGTVTVGP